MSMTLLKTVNSIKKRVMCALCVTKLCISGSKTGMGDPEERLPLSLGSDSRSSVGEPDISNITKLN